MRTTPTSDTPDLLVMAKAPVPGRVKTRLCPPLSLVEAAGVAEAALIDTLDAVSEANAGRRLLVLDGEPGSWLAPGFRVVAQRGVGFGARLGAAFREVPGPALLVGMDTPQVTADLLDHCGRVLMEPGVDAVLGAAEDGGWWIIGLRHADPRLFVGVPMSTPETCRAQRDRLRRLGLRSVDLPMLRDVDRYEDAVAVADLAPGTNFARALRSLNRQPVSP